VSRVSKWVGLPLACFVFRSHGREGFVCAPVHVAHCSGATDYDTLDMHDEWQADMCVCDESTIGYVVGVCHRILPWPSFCLASRLRY